MLKTENKEDIIHNTFKQANAFVDLVMKGEYQHNNLISKIPLATNCVFACELYLKVLLLYYGDDVSQMKKYNHNLKKMFFSLPKEVQNRLSIWLKTFTLIRLDTFLEEVKDSFINLRYNSIEQKIKEFDLKNVADFMFKLQHETSMLLVGYDIYEYLYGKKKEM